MKYLIYAFFVLISFFLCWFFITAFKSNPAIENAAGTQQQAGMKKGKLKKEGFGWLFWVVVAIGTGIFSAGAYKFVEYANFKKNGVRSTGTVSSKILRSKKTKDSPASYDVYVTFTVEDKEYTFKSPSSNIWRDDKVDVLYMPDNPEKAIAVKGAVLGSVIIMGLSFMAVFVFLSCARTVIIDKKM